jgi:segregation and condensation protein B
MAKQNNKHLLMVIEGALFATHSPLTAQDLVKLFPEDEKPALGVVRETIQKLQSEYEGRGIHLIESASGYRFQVVEAVVPYIVKNMDEKPARYSRALLETLALIAYRQPITRGEIEDIRGVVVSSNIIQTLQEQEWIKIVGHKEVPGKPALFATTKTFLDHFGLKSLQDLPPLAELKDFDSLQLPPEMADAPQAAAPEAIAEPTIVATDNIENTVETQQTHELPELVTEDAE